MTISSASRFASPELLSLGKPPALAAKPFQTLFDEWRSDFLGRMAAAGLPYEVQTLETDPAMVTGQSDSYRDMLRRQEIDDVVAASYLGSAVGAMLDYRAADYGVARRVLQVANPVTGAAQEMEDDDSLRLRARLAWEALSVAGTPGAYVFHALDAHPDVFSALPIGPETGIVSPGEGLIVVQSRSGNGVPSDEVLDVIADRHDAYEIRYGSGTVALRPSRSGNSIRVLGVRVTVAAARPLTYTTAATIYVGSYSDSESIRLAALTNLNAYQESRRRIGLEVPVSARVAALHLTGVDGLPVVEEVEVAGADVVPAYDQIPVPLAPVVNVVVR